MQYNFIRVILSGIWLDINVCVDIKLLITFVRMRTRILIIIRQMNDFLNRLQFNIWISRFCGA